MLVVGSIFFLFINQSKASEYKEQTAYFTQVTVVDINKLHDNSIDKYILYTGRETCPHCVIFVPKLYNVAKSNDYYIYYLDSEDTPTNSELKVFREEYDIEFVPNLSVFQGELKIGSLEITDDTTEDEIKKFIDTFYKD